MEDNNSGDTATDLQKMANIVANAQQYRRAEVVCDDQYRCRYQLNSIGEGMYGRRSATVGKDGTLENVQIQVIDLCDVQCLDFGSYMALV